MRLPAVVIRDVDSASDECYRRLTKLFTQHEEIYNIQ